MLRPQVLVQGMSPSEWETAIASDDVDVVVIEGALAAAAARQRVAEMALLTPVTCQHWPAYRARNSRSTPDQFGAVRPGRGQGAPGR
jgi:hypothetical protein